MSCRINPLPRTIKLLCFALSALVAAAQQPESASPVVSGKPDLSWALGYDGQYSDALAGDKNLIGFVRQQFDTYRLPFWNPDRPSTAVVDFLGGPSDPVVVQGTRYLSASGCVAHFCADKGFFWLDIKTRESLLGFVNMDRSASGNQPHLWLLLGPPITFSAIPDPALKSVQRWYGTFSSEKSVLQGSTLKPEKIAKVTEIEAASGTTLAVSPDRLFSSDTSVANQSNTQK